MMDNFVESPSQNGESGISSRLESEDRAAIGLAVARAPPPTFSKTCVGIFRD